jgi:hypothetical protein
MSDELLEECARSREEQTGAVAGVLDAAAAVLDAVKARERQIDQIPGRAVRIGDGPDSATASSRMIAKRARDRRAAGNGLRSSFRHRASSSDTGGR